ncbi:HAD family hydrolase [Peribacillus sp. SCS-26]|uniref:HAD family hydrolase n=1 Tax=Paraperibacillus marinus TaxID=3115295 RepID=UPI003905A8E9
MIFATDLDRTMIYSKRACGHELERSDIAVVEKTPEREISYMTEKGIELLRKVNQTIDLIPVTTRTVDLYRRIGLFRDSIVPRYAVVSNGGTILVDGRLDEEWAALLRRKLEDECAPHQDVMKKLEEIQHEDWALGSRVCDNLFCFTSVRDDRVPHDVIEDFGHWLGEQGWSLSLQERKLYLLPNAVNKWAAVAYLKERTGAAAVAAAGDSLLDMCMLDVADIAYTPRHGELFQKGSGLPGRVKVTESAGISAAEEILEGVLGSFDGIIVGNTGESGVR